MLENPWNVSLKMINGSACSVASTLGTALQRCGAFEDAAQAFTDGIAAGRTIGDSNAVISLYGDLIGLFVEQSKLHQAYAYCQEALQFIESSYQKRGRYTPGAAHIHFRLSTILRHWNDLEGSLNHARISDEILEKWGLQYRLNFINLAIALHAVGEYVEAHRVLRRCGTDGRTTIYLLGRKCKSYPGIILAG